MRHNCFKKGVALALTAMMLIGGCGAPAETTTQAPETTKTPETTAAPAEDVTYVGEAQGFGGVVTAYVTVDASGKIVSVQAEGLKETIGKGSVVLEQLPDAIVAAGSTEVEGITGATMTSNALKAAVDAALTNKVAVELDTDEVSIAYKAGTYTGKAFGHNNDIVVEVTFTADTISDIKIVEDKSDKAMQAAVHAQLPTNILEAQSLNVDIVSGATESSNAVINAVAQCVQEAAGEDAVKALLTKDRAVIEVENVEYIADVAVVGGGGSGLTTAYYLASNGYKVVVLEAADILGGMTNVCGGGSLSIGSQIQKDAEVYESDEQIAELLDTQFDILFAASDYQARAGFIREYTDALDEYADWAMAAGIPYTSSGLKGVRLGNKGARFNTMIDKMTKEYGTIILTGTRGTELIMADGSVAGVIGTNETGGTTTVKASAVVLATGGFLSNAEMCQELIPQYSEYWENWSGSTRYQGDGVQMAWAVGAAKGEVGVQPHDNQIPEAIHSLGISTHSPSNYGSAAFYPSLWVTRAGERFINEDVANGNAEKHGATTLKEGVYYTILDQAMITKLENEGSAIGGWMSTKNKPLTGLQDDIARVIELGYAFKADTIEDLAVQMGMDPKVLAKEVADYNAIVKSGVDNEFGKDSKYLDCTIEDGPFYGFTNVTRVLAAYGGLDISEDMEVLDTNGMAIPGLYAVGLDAGSFMGNIYSVTTVTAGFAITSGYMAGESICEFLAEK